MSQLSTSHVFMSYSRRDEIVMRRVVAFLRKQGLNVWVDNEKLVPGTPIWETEIENAIFSAGAVVVLLSPDSKNSPWVRREISYAEDNDKRIFPILVAGNQKDTVPIRLTNHQRIDIRENEEDGLNSLTIALSFYLDNLEAEEKKAHNGAEKMAQAEIERSANQKAEEKRIAKAKLEAERLAEEKRRTDEVEKARKAKEETEQIAEEKRRANEAEKKRLAKLEAEKLAAQKAKDERLAKARIESERLAREKAEAERKAKEKAERSTKKDTDVVTQEFKKKAFASKVTAPQPQPSRSPLLPIGIASIAIVGILVCGYAAYNLFGGAPTATPSQSEAHPALTEEVTKEPPRETATPLPPFSAKSLTASNCDYGGFVKSIEATDRYTVTFNLCKPDSAFLSRIALDNFAIYPEEWIEATANNGTRSTGGLEHPIGTGPYKVSEWIRGDQLTFSVNSDYWGSPPKAETLIFRWAGESSQRLLELQSGSVDGLDNVNQDDFGSVSNDPNLSLLIRPSLNVSFIGITNTFAPFDNQLVRQALAMGIDRQRIVNNFYPLGTELAMHFVPCYIPNGCVGDAWYDFDPEEARALLAEAGYPDGFTTKIYYRDVVRSYLPQPGDVAQDIQTQLRGNLNIETEIVRMESGDFIQELVNGQIDGLYLYGWSADYPHPTSFMDYTFDEATTMFGTQSSTYSEALTTAAQIADPAQAEPLYTEANNAIREYVPMIPVAHTGSNMSYQADVANQPASALGTESFSEADPNNRDTFVWMQISEPISLFCADESDLESLRACAQIMESLYSYDINGTEATPALAEQCDPNGDSTIWVCTLRQGVTFHDGTTFDANDVVATFTMGLDASSPLHAGNTNVWSYYDFIWGLINKPQ